MQQQVQQVPCCKGCSQLYEPVRCRWQACPLQCPRTPDWPLWHLKKAKPYKALPVAASPHSCIRWLSIGRICLQQGCAHCNSGCSSSSHCNPEQPFHQITGCSEAGFWWSFSHSHWSSLRSTLTWAYKSMRAAKAAQPCQFHPERVAHCQRLMLMCRHPDGRGSRRPQERASCGPTSCLPPGSTRCGRRQSSKPSGISGGRP